MGLLSAIGGAIGLAVGGPLGAALGSGIGSLAGGGDFGDALKSGILGYGIGSISGAQGLASNAINAVGGGNLLSQLGGAGGAATAQGGAGGLARQVAQAAGGAGGAAGAAGGAAAGGGIGNLLGNLANSPIVMATVLEALQPRGSILNERQQRMMETGERLPDYRGTPAPDYRYGGRYPTTVSPVPVQRAMGGMIEGPGTGTSDSIPAMIYQNGGPVQEARLSDGEFVMTADAVRGAGNGDRAKGAAKMYEMMARLERRA